MTSIKRTALVPYSPAQMFALVNDIERYPEFLPWCRQARVLSRDGERVQASLTVAKGPLHYQFSTANTLQPDTRIDMQLLEGPFRSLHGVWRFVPIPGGGCQVDLALEFEFHNRILHRTMGRLFEEIAGTLVDAFCRRAHASHQGADRAPAQR